MPTRRLSIARVFADLGAPLKNARWSWGAVGPGDTVILREWDTNVALDADGREYVIVGRGERAGARKRAGWTERKQHIARIKDGARCLIVVCKARDPGASSKSIKSVADEMLECRWADSPGDLARLVVIGRRQRPGVGLE